MCSSNGQPFVGILLLSSLPWMQLCAWSAVDMFVVKVTRDVSPGPPFVLTEWSNSTWWASCSDKSALTWSWRRDASSAYLVWLAVFKWGKNSCQQLYILSSSPSAQPSLNSSTNAQRWHNTVSLLQDDCSCHTDAGKVSTVHLLHVATVAMARNLCKDLQKRWSCCMKLVYATFPL